MLTSLCVVASKLTFSLAPSFLGGLDLRSEQKAGIGMTYNVHRMLLRSVGEKKRKPSCRLWVLGK